MNICKYIKCVGEKDQEEKTLDYILDDGGCAAIFRSIACIGDSLSSGMWEAVDEYGAHSYYGSICK